VRISHNGKTPVELPEPEAMFTALSSHASSCSWNYRNRRRRSRTIPGALFF